MSQFVSSLQFVASSSTSCPESVRQFVAPYIDTGTTTNTQGLHNGIQYGLSSLSVEVLTAVGSRTTRAARTEQSTTYVPQEMT